MKNLPAFLMCCALVAWVAAYIGEPNYEAAYWFTLDALAKVCITGAVALKLHRPAEKLIAVNLFILASSNLSDELFFDPTVTSVNEYFFAAIVALYTTFKLAVMYASRPNK